MRRSRSTPPCSTAPPSRPQTRPSSAASSRSTTSRASTSASSSRPLPRHVAPAPEIMFKLEAREREYVRKFLQERAAAAAAAGRGGAPTGDSRRDRPRVPRQRHRQAIHAPRQHLRQRRRQPRAAVVASPPGRGPHRAHRRSAPLTTMPSLRASSRRRRAGERAAAIFTFFLFFFRASGII
ncbi:hypothetical protein OsJ_06601 [Oryza sativa Japonica Group]|uniref:Uncharacterized protein n=1 Tax=Oryza sativa subsp. japonica TaxID=39947 RepID=Q6K7K7_ORYSJ|nr:hypothetical protein OsJ_06601 [Oryza sativa Japonica Group]KAF2944650.1 hypothetical protein DAI22_02g158301 [Oryza sativa Japonica Group]BAD19502.1 unknown protein [Oryza sativa Japonica Group]